MTSYAKAAHFSGCMGGAWGVVEGEGKKLLRRRTSQQKNERKTRERM